MIMPSDYDRQASSADEQQLAMQAGSGDREALAELLQRSYDDLLRFCYRYMANIHAAEDVVQDVLTTISSGRHWPTGAFRPWLYRVARNRCLDLLKRRNDGRAGAGSVMRASRWASPRTGPRTAVFREERHDRIQRVMDRMSDPHREVLTLRYFEDLNRKEIAEVLELSESVVKSRLFEARRELRRLLGETKL
ncbi:MAG: RNA polymerase sigma factor [Planctomycetota bacterium]|jgi:RNA polymerase sigma-70 factor (ECF subfamily)